MDVSALLIFHSYYRWVVLLAMLFQLAWLWYNNRRQTVFVHKHLYIVLGLTILYDVQLLIGFLLYCHSPLVDAFLQNVGLGIKNRQLRFFGLEHASVMSVALLLGNIVAIRCAKKVGQQQVFRYVLRWYTAIFLLILSSVPWSFSPLTSRPSFR